MSQNDSLDRFVSAQQDSYAGAHAEIVAGRKTTHWMWFIYPQLRGLGRSPRSEYYGIADLREATAYLAHPVLGPRLVEMFAILRDRHSVADPVDIFGQIDAAKLRSSATLFDAVPDTDPVFGHVLNLHFDAPCRQTLERL